MRKYISWGFLSFDLFIFKPQLILLFPFNVLVIMYNKFVTIIWDN